MSKDPDHGAHLDFAKSMSYGDYLNLDKLLSCQNPLSDAHDEMLFLVIHQASELWMKLAIHELTAAVAAIRRDELQPAFKMLARVSRIQGQMIQSWDVLATMTPADYSSFRDKLGMSSGFQSYQYRSMEFLLGSKDRAMLKPHEHRPDLHKLLTDLLEAPSLYDEAIRLLARRGLSISQTVLNRDVTQHYDADESVLAAWAEVYKNSKSHWDLYELAEELVDLEDSFQVWRFRHMKTVQRVIGFKRGTGGTAGVEYLRRAVDRPFFPELWQVRTEV
ncbi:tryptophan 2,3-dioxygenase [Lacibacterium aquatile]|uniref:Tryptophan 2,3-dioxygenase n=1 Tax=Lacibacterium aquatile TaxID=1168082 RepID=A0ABW5DUP1_9PROT